VSDGCSGSPVPGEPGSPFTDWGARFMARARSSGSSSERCDLRSVLSRIAHVTWREQPRFPGGALDATLIVAEKRGDSVRVMQAGDGVVGRT